MLIHQDRHAAADRQNSQRIDIPEVLTADEGLGRRTHRFQRTGDGVNV